MHKECRAEKCLLRTFLFPHLCLWKPLNVSSYRSSPPPPALNMDWFTVNNPKMLDVLALYWTSLWNWKAICVFVNRCGFYKREYASIFVISLVALTLQIRSSVQIALLMWNARYGGLRTPTGPYPEAHELSPHPPLILCQDHFNIIKYYPPRQA